MSCAAILKQPVESLDAIILEIDAARDLLSLSLTCQALYAIVQSRHLHFRVISCRLEDWRSIEVWDLLAHDKTLARSVRVLQLQPLGIYDPRFLIPLSVKRCMRERRSRSNKAQASASSVSGYERYADAITHLIPALKNMSRLISFTWTTRMIKDPLLDAFFRDPKDIMGQVWTALSGCREIRILQVQHDWYQGKSFYEVIGKD